MKRTSEKSVAAERGGWLLFFYSIPSKPVSSRMKIWRKLSKAGSIQLKGAVYVLPMNEEHYEFFQWLVSEVSSMGGEAAFTYVRTIDSVQDAEIRASFAERLEREYLAINRFIDEVETKISSLKKGSKAQDAKVLLEQLARAGRNCEETLRTDFFLTKSGTALRSRIAGLDASLRGLAGVLTESRTAVVPSGKREDYQGRVWVSRRRPFVDRMASAWLIRRFIDRDCSFRLVDEKDLAAEGQGNVTFDAGGAVFTHMGDYCTFEVLVRAFGIKDKAVRKIAETVHDLDLKDGKYKAPEAKGIEEILKGIRQTSKDDNDSLERGMAVFEMLWQAKH